MVQHLIRLIGSAALAAILALPAVAQEYSNGGKGKKGRGDATRTPVEAYGVHPPGPDPADLHRCIFHRWKCIFRPYYAPVSPVATSVRWKPWCYFPLLPWYTPYYIGYCPHRLCNAPPRPYGSDGWGEGPMPTDAPCRSPLNYGVFSSILMDDTIFWNMGGNGLVPYGTPRPPHSGPPDLMDSIQVTRQQGGGIPCGSPVDGAPLLPVSDQTASSPATVLPAAQPDRPEGDQGVKVPRKPPVTETPGQEEGSPTGPEIQGPATADREGPSK